MDFWSRLIGTALPPKKPAAKPAANDPQVRLARFKRVYHTVLELCNRPRNLATEGPLLIQLHILLDRIALLLREEARAPVPHTCLQFSKANSIFAVIAKAATVSQDEPVIRSAVAIFSALVDSEEEDFLSSSQFAKSLMRLVRKVLESGNLLVNTETETVILELLFTISAKIRLQPEILPVWFQSTAKPPQEDVFNDEKEKGVNFVGTTQKDDFPLCYLLIDRVHHEGRIGDFARTGLLYVFEATGRSEDLEEWVVASDLPTLMASGLGALYSQLSRELSILHPDATLPPVLAMSDYTTTHLRATAESAFSERHRAHISTFLSYLAFWQDVLDHCRSNDVKQTLLDHFKILFLEQLLYPSLLQSSDTDAGSSIAVLTYMTSIFEALEYPDLINMILNYLLAIQETTQAIARAEDDTSTKLSTAPRSPTSVKRRQSLMLLNASKKPDDAVDPNVFNLVDLITNNIGSQNSQSVYSALKLSTTILARQKKYAFGTLLKVQSSKAGRPGRTIGALEKEVAEYAQLARDVHQESGLDAAYQSLCEDIRYSIEAQLLPKQLKAASKESDELTPERYILLTEDPFLRALRGLLRTFTTNSIEVNLALSQMLITIASCNEVNLDGWLAVSPSAYTFSAPNDGASRTWQSYLDSEEETSWTTLRNTISRPLWDADGSPIVYQELRAIAAELDTVQAKVPNLKQLIDGRKKLLQGGSIDNFPGESTSMANSPIQQSAYLEVPQKSGSSNRTLREGPHRSPTGKAANPASSPQSASSAASRAASRSPSRGATSSSNARAASPAPQNSLFKPPPPETPSTTDVLMQTFEFPMQTEGDEKGVRSASLNHILTNVVVLQEFILEIVAVLQVRAAILGDAEVRME